MGFGGGSGGARRLLQHSRRLLFTATAANRNQIHHHHHWRAYERPPGLPSKLKDSSSSASQFSRSSPFCSSSAACGSRKGFVNWYLGMIEARPVLTKSLTAGLIFTVADLCSQTISSNSSDSFDLMRTFRMAGYGTLISGPSLHLWFNFLSRILPKTDVITTFKKMFLGQTFYGPIIMTVFFSYNAALQGENGAEILARLKRDLLPTLINGLIYWPTCDFITFKFIPVRLQPLVSNSFSLFWTIYITYMASLKKAEPSKISSD